LQIVFAQRNFGCATIVSITQCVAVHCEALANTVEGYIAATLGTDKKNALVICQTIRRIILDFASRRTTLAFTFSVHAPAQYL